MLSSVIVRNMGEKLWRLKAANFRLIIIIIIIIIIKELTDGKGRECMDNCHVT
jgi:hypothetical protein